MFSSVALEMSDFWLQNKNCKDFFKEKENCEEKLLKEKRIVRKTFKEKDNCQENKNCEGKVSTFTFPWLQPTHPEALLPVQRINWEYALVSK